MTPSLPDPLLRAVLEFPDDDGPRLVCADWWDEASECARAEFVRVQCELAEWPCECDTSEERVYHDECRCKERAELRRRGRELIQSAMAWVPVRGVAGRENVQVCDCWEGDRTGNFPLYATYYFRRGFPEVVSCSAGWWLAHGDAVTAAAPVRRASLTTWPDFTPGQDFLGRPTARLYGRENYRPVAPGLFVPQLLAAEFPGITFELPPAVVRPPLTPTMILQ